MMFLLNLHLKFQMYSNSTPQTVDIVSSFREKLVSLKQCTLDDIQILVRYSIEAAVDKRDYEIIHVIETYLRSSSSELIITGLYVVDGILNGARDIYLKSLGPKLEALIALCHRVCLPEHRSKVLKTLYCWKDKKIITESYYKTILNGIDHPVLKRMKVINNNTDVVETLEELENIKEKQISRTEPDYFDNILNRAVDMFPVCNYKLFIEDKLKEHMKDVLDINSSVAIFPKRMNEGISMLEIVLYKCESCKLAFRSESKQKSHIDEHTEEKINFIMRRNYYRTEIVNKYQNKTAVEEIVEKKLSLLTKKSLHIEGILCCVCGEEFGKKFDEKAAEFVIDGGFKLTDKEWVSLFEGNNVDAGGRHVHIQCLRNQLMNQI